MFRIHGASRRISAVLIFAGSATLAGCGSSDESVSRPLTADQFAARGASIPPDGGRLTGAPVDQPGAIRYDGAGRFAEPPAPSADPNIPTAAQRINPAVDSTVKSPYRTEGSAVATTNPAPGSPAAQITTPPGGAPGDGAPVIGGPGDGGPRAVDVGFVVMEVNGTPIYSDKVLSVLERPLAAEARKNSRDNFRQLARTLLERQVELYKRDELEVASADLALEEADKLLAQALTTQWRQQQITAAGGSLELARQRAREQGADFDELVQQQYRLKLVQIFYQKRIFPKIFVPPADQRAYYEQNKAEFSQPSRLKFRVIKIDPKAVGFKSDQDAYDLARKVQERAKTEDFAKLADEINKDGRGGAIGLPDSKGWVDANSYRYEEVEKAVAKLKPGEVTDVITGPDRLLFVAKLEEVQEGKVQPFEDPAVQDAITQRLKGMQLQSLREAHVRKLEQNAVTRRNEGKLDDMLAIVMRKYPEWAKPG